MPVYSVFRPDLKHQSLLTDNRVCPSNFDISDGQIRFSVKCARLGEANPFGNFQKLRELKEGRLASTVRPIPPQREEGRLRQVPDSRILSQCVKLLGSHFPQVDNPLLSGMPLLDELCIHALKVCEHNELMQRRAILTFPFSAGLASRHCLAVIPNKATFSTSASLA